MWLSHQDWSTAFRDAASDAETSAVANGFCGARSNAHQNRPLLLPQTHTILKKREYQQCRPSELQIQLFYLGGVFCALYCPLCVTKGEQRTQAKAKVKAATTQPCQYHSLTRKYAGVICNVYGKEL